MVLCDAYDKEKLEGDDERIVMHIHPALAPIKACVCPLSKKLSEEAYKVYEDLVQEFSCEYDEAGSIGKRYRRNDAIGTPYCITFDFDSVDDKAVTIRERDSMEQIRLPISELKDFLREKTKF